MGLTRSIQSLLLVLAAAMLSAAAAPVAFGSATLPVASHQVEQTPSEIRSYWTPERMRDAIPLDSPETAVAVAAGNPPSARSAPPDQETDPALDTLYPQRIHGKLFVKRGNTNATCSATVVTSFTRDLILTAGHCLAIPGPQLGQVTWSENVLFVPAYRNATAPFGVYAATTLRAPGQWSFEGDISFDLGAANLSPVPTGRTPAVPGPIQDVLGSRGVSFNHPLGSYRGKSVEIYGYPGEPAAFGYDAERLILCISPLLGIETETGALAAGPCHQQEGSSGGGWVLPGGLVNSVVSHVGCAVASIECTTISGTFFGDIAFQLWTAAAGGIPKGRKKQIKRCKRFGRKGKRERCVNRAETFQPVLR